LLGGANLTLSELFGHLERLTGVRAPSRRGPYTAALGFPYLSEFWAAHVTGRSPQASVTGVRLTRRTMHFDASQSLAELGLTVRPVEESIADAVSWLGFAAARTGQIGKTREFACTQEGGRLT